MKSLDVSLIFSKKRARFSDVLGFKIDCEIPWFSLTLAKLHSALYSQNKTTNWLRKGETIFSKNIKNIWRVERTHFQKMRPKMENSAPWRSHCFPKSALVANFPNGAAQIHPCWYIAQKHVWSTTNEISSVVFYLNRFELMSLENYIKQFTVWTIYVAVQA